jgi:DNA (cytosine-5)-methyltransferase 3A
VFTARKSVLQLQESYFFGAFVTERVKIERKYAKLKALNVLSLFDGISCGLIALDRAGIPVDNYFASEIDSSAIAISEQNHKNIIRLGDVKNWREWDLPKIDLIIGGSPCQGFSRAGKGLNFDDPRSELFFDYVDIMEAQRAKNPDLMFLLENVQMKTAWRDTISDFLSVQPIRINSSLLSAQNRVRDYWTNIEGVELPKDKEIKLLDILWHPVPDDEYILHDELLFDPSISLESRNLVSCIGGEVRIRQAVKQGYIVAENGDGINLQFPASKTRRGRVIKQKSPTLDCSCEVCVLQDGVIRKFTTRELERLQTLPDGYTAGFPRTTAQKAIGNGWTVDVIAHILAHIRTGGVHNG